MTEPEQIDKDIDISSPVYSGNGHGKTGKRSVSGIVWFFGITVILLVAVLILLSGNTSSFNTEMLPEEKEMRSLMISVAFDIHEYYDQNGILPLIPGDINIPSENITFTAEDGDFDPPSARFRP